MCLLYIIVVTPLAPGCETASIPNEMNLPFVKRFSFMTWVVPVTEEAKSPLQMFTLCSGPVLEYLYYADLTSCVSCMHVFACVYIAFDKG